MADIYKQHDAAFANVSAYVIMKDGERVATVAFKYPKDGAGRLCAYVHWIGSEMVRGFASGYGYDKKSAACSNAMKRILPPNNEEAEKLNWCAFCEALARDDGNHWDRCLRDAGFAVLQAV